MATGLDKGQPVTNNVSKPRHCCRKGHLTKHTGSVRDLICRARGVALRCDGLH
uniref:Large ribosomal subunit protein eL36 n=1 Tax=Callorhinchus milii TaxID=7868 RepID=A0A4W3K400_CALMI